MRTATAVTLDKQLAARQRPANRSPSMYQKWRDLLFLHWEFDADVIQQTLPPGLNVDTFEGRAYLGVVPFFMLGIRPKFLPAVPGLSKFLELNLRTYVVDRHGTPGVWFYSLDANQWLAVRIARAFFHLPYFDARMSATIGADAFLDYRCHRKGTPESLASCFRYRAAGKLPNAEPGSLEFFLVERYVLFAYDRRGERLFSGTVHHVPYPLCDVEVNAHSDAVIELAGFDRPHRPPDHAIMSKGVDVDVFAIEPVK